MSMLKKNYRYDPVGVASSIDPISPGIESYNLSLDVSGNFFYQKREDNLDAKTDFKVGWCNSKKLPAKTSFYQQTTFFLLRVLVDVRAKKTGKTQSGFDPR